MYATKTPMFFFRVLECVARQEGGATGRWRELVIARGRAGCARVGSDRGWGCRCVPGVLGVGCRWVPVRVIPRGGSARWCLRECILAR